MPSDGGFTRLNWRAREFPEGTDGTTSVASFMWFWDTATQSYLPSWLLLTAQFVHRLRTKISSSHFCTPSRARSLSTTALSERRCVAFALFSGVPGLGAAGALSVFGRLN